MTEPGDVLSVPDERNTNIEAPEAQLRSDDPDQGLFAASAARLRSLTGVHERILDLIPTERPRYTSLGAVVLGTALAATISMAVALHWVFDSWLPTLCALLWGLFILSLDRWLVSSAVSSGNARSNMVRMIPRLILALAVGTVVAEPLMLAVFNSAVVSEATAQRAQSLLAYESKLVNCNPVPGTSASTPPNCAFYSLSIDNQSTALSTELTSVQAQLAALTNKFDADESEFQRLEAKAAAECAGTQTAGTSGKPGDGPRCLADRNAAAQFREVSSLDKNAAQMQVLQSRVIGLTGEVATSQSSYTSQLNAQIQARVAAYQKAQGKLGILERMRALGTLSEGDTYVFVGQWSLRLFIVLIDALPAITRLLMGVTAYDRIAANRIRQAVALQSHLTESAGMRRVDEDELERESHRLRLLRLRNEIEFESSLAEVALESRRSDLISRRIDDLLANDVQSSLSSVVVPRLRTSDQERDTRRT